ncbi:MAG TPA: metallophosphoesterase family protein [Solirubrobacteraceae bacterium]|nr:metallophosphoesterase family protein [Solirubrobacteraceae bacterium]
MRLLGFSDIHCDLAGARRLVALADEADVVIGAGDFASVHQGLAETVAVLEAIDKPTVLVAGNNETDDALRRATAGWTTASVLHGEQVEIAGTLFFGLGGGVPVTPWEWSFDLTEREARSKLAGCPDGGVLVVHSPPKNHVDGHPGRHLGSVAIVETIEARQPLVAVCGHVHECWGQEATIGRTRVLNLGPSGTFITL